MSNKKTPQKALVSSGILGIHHVGMSVSNLSEAVSFYKATASLEEVSHEAICGALPITPKQSAVLKSPNGYLQLMQFDAEQRGHTNEIPVQGPGVTHNCFQCPAPDKLFNKFIAAGATSVSRAEPPIDLNGAGYKYAYVRDADAIMFEIEEVDKPPFEGPIWIAHVALVSHDINRLVNFYQTLFGIEPHRRANKIGGPRWNEVTDLEDVHVRAAWFNTGNMVLELWEYVSPKTEPPGEPLAFDKLGYNNTAYEVADLQRERIRLENTGLEFLGDTVEENGVLVAYARDPDGNLFSLLQTGPEATAKVADLLQIHWLPSPSNPSAL